MMLRREKYGVLSLFRDEVIKMLQSDSLSYPQIAQ
jgi:hypothetical protein